MRDESGIALVMSMGILATMAAMLAGALDMTASGSRSASYSGAGQNAYALAESGLNNAISVLEANYPGTVQYPGDSTLLPSRTTQYPNGSVTWSGTLTHVTGKAWGWQWNLTSTSRVANPTGPGSAAETRTVSAIVPVVMPSTQAVGDSSILNWIYAFRDATFNNSVTIGSPVYAGNNLTLDNKASIAGTARKIGVGAVLTMRQNADGVGSSSSRIGQEYIVGGCTWLGSGLTLHNPCRGDTDNVWAAPLHDVVLADGTTIPSRGSTIPQGLITPPTLTCCSLGSSSVAPSTMGFWYVNASPGPDSPCDAATKSGTPPTFDTGDGTINNSATPSTPFNLTPYGASYTCKTTDGNGNTVGELSWDASRRVLTVKGTVFIDGSAKIDKGLDPGHPVFRYSGLGTLYLSGTFSVSGTIICAATTSSDCNWTSGAWNPNQTALVVVADGDGAYGGAQSQGNVVQPGDGIDIAGTASFQGALLAAKNVQIGQSAEEQGPMISVYSSITTGQSGTLTFPSTDFMPAGAAGVTAPIPPGNLLPPQQFGG